jgi:hypothetical protein
LIKVSQGTSLFIKVVISSIKLDDLAVGVKRRRRLLGVRIELKVPEMKAYLRRMLNLVLVHRIIGRDSHFLISGFLSRVPN